MDIHMNIHNVNMISMWINESLEQEDVKLQDTHRDSVASLELRRKRNKKEK